MIYVRSPEPSFVAHLDLLGVKAAIRRNASAVWGALCQLLEVRERVLGLTISISSSGQKISDRVSHFTFSDTVVLYTRRDQDEDLYAIALLAAEMFQRGLDEALPIRAGLAHGGFIADSSLQLFTGPALVDAYDLGEKSDWLGLSVDPSTAVRANELPLQSHGHWPFFVPWDVPQNGGPVRKGFVLDWPVVYHAKTGKPPLISGEEIFSDFSYLFGSWDALRPDVREKYEQTARFWNARKEAFYSEPL